MVDDGSLQAERVNLNSFLNTIIGGSKAPSEAFLELKPNELI